MEIDSFDAVIDQILAFNKGDIRLALRAVLIETVLLQEELRINAAASPHARPIRQARLRRKSSNPLAGVYRSD
jgi:hypothetical protein